MKFADSYNVSKVRLGILKEDRVYLHGEILEALSTRHCSMDVSETVSYSNNYTCILA